MLLRGYTEVITRQSCVIRLGIFSSKFYFFRAERRKKKLTSKNTKAFYTIVRDLNCLLLYDLAFSNANPSRVHTSIDLAFIELSS